MKLYLVVPKGTSDFDTPFLANVDNIHHKIDQLVGTRYTLDIFYWDLVKSKATNLTREEDDELRAYLDQVPPTPSEHYISSLEEV